MILSTHTGQASCDLMDCWDATTTELGLDTGGAAGGGAPSQTPDQPADTRPSEPSDTGADRHSAEPTEPVAEVDDDDDPDALDLLADRDEPEPGEPSDKAADPKYKALSKRARKLERSLKKHLPTVHALKELGLDVRTLAERHRLLSNIEAAAERDPRIRAALLGVDEPSQTDRDTRRIDNGRRAQPDDDVEYPFDTKDGPGRFVAELDKRVRTNGREVLDRLDRLERSIGERVQRIEGNLTATQRSTAMRDWRTASEAAAAQLEPAVRPIFLDVMHAAARGYVAGDHQKSVAAVVQHYLKGLKVSKGQQDRATSAAQQRTADANNNLPRRPTAANGRPASPQSKAVPRLSEFNRQLQQRFGAA